MAGSTTVYDIVTRYRVDDHASHGLRNYNREARAAARQSRGLSRSIGSVSGGIALMGRRLLPMIGGLTAGGTAAAALTKTFLNLKTAQESTLSIAGLFNLAFKYDNNPGKNFAESMKASRGFVRELVHDAARLPGTLSDFVRGANTLMLPVLSAGGSTKTVRDLIASLAIIQPVASTDMYTLMRNAMMAIQGRARIQEPLFPLLRNLSGLNTQQFNALTPAKRLDVLTKSLDRMAASKGLRAGVAQLIDTQFTTLSDNLFGLEGILGKLGADPFQGLIEGLKSLNSYLDKHKKGIIFAAGLFTGGSRQQLGITAEQEKTFLREPKIKHLDFLGGATSLGQYLSSGVAKDIIRRRALNLYLEHHPSINPVNYDPGIIPFKGKEFQGYIADSRRLLIEMMHQTTLHPPAPKGTNRLNLHGDSVTNNIAIKVDLKSDESPEAIAVKLGKALRKASQKPTVARRAPNLNAQPNTVN